jgi:hypothetical protein
MKVHKNPTRVMTLGLEDEVRTLDLREPIRNKVSNDKFSSWGEDMFVENGFVSSGVLVFWEILFSLFGNKIFM